MKVENLIKQLEPYKDFDVQARVHLEVVEEELQKRTYKYPHNTYNAELSVDDIGYSDKVVVIGVEIERINIMSMISEQVKELRSAAEVHKNNSKYMVNLLNSAADTIEALSAKLFAANMERSQRYYNSKWIPCKERIPFTRNNLLVCQKDGYVSVGYYSQGQFLDLNSNPFENVIAWCELPEPYHEP